MLNPRDCVLYSGGLRGAEAAFGAAAERHGVEEVNFTFDEPPDRPAARRAHAEPRRAPARRRQPRLRLEADAPPLPGDRLHQEGAADDLAPGEQRPGDLRRRHVLDDDTVMGGTGWGAEFGKLCNKPLYVFDQQRNEWLRWNGTALGVVPAVDHAPALLRQRHTAPEGQRPGRDRLTSSSARSPEDSGRIGVAAARSAASARHR